MRTLMRRTVRTAVEAGLVYLAFQAVDGTKIPGNASKDRTYNAKGLRRLLNHVETAIKDLESQNSTGVDSSTASLPEELASTEALRKRVKEALARVEQKEGANHENLTDQDAGLLKTSGGNFVAGYNAQAMAAPLKSLPLDSPDQAPDDHDVSGMIITAVGVAANSDDHPQLIPMIEASADNTGDSPGADTQPTPNAEASADDASKSQPTVTLADAGYHSGANLAECDSSGHHVLMPQTHDRKRLWPYHKDHFTYRTDTDTYLCPEGQVLSYGETFRHEHGYIVRRYRAQAQVCQACPAFGECTTSTRGRTVSMGEYESLLQGHRQTMATDWAKDLYGWRKALIEPVFGILKDCHAARRFLLRGRHNVLCEWYLLATAFNLKSLHRVWRSSPQPTPPRMGVSPNPPKDTDGRREESGRGG